MLPGPAVPGCCLTSFHFRWGKPSTRTVLQFPVKNPVGQPCILVVLLCTYAACSAAKAFSVIQNIMSGSRSEEITMRSRLQVGRIYPRPDSLGHADRQHLRPLGQERVRRLCGQLPHLRQLDDGLLRPRIADDGQGARHILLRLRVVLQQEVPHQRRCGERLTTLQNAKVILTLCLNLENDEATRRSLPSFQSSYSFDEVDISSSNGFRQNNVTRWNR